MEINVFEMAFKENAALSKEPQISKIVKESMKISESNEGTDLPKEVIVNFKELGFDDIEVQDSDIQERMEEYISDNFGCSTSEFELEVIRDESEIPQKVIASEIEWDLDEQKEPKAKTNKIQLEKLRFVEDKEEFSDIQPDEDIMVVYSDAITPNMSDEEVKDAVNNLVGATVCKCGKCGANYVVDDKKEEDSEIIFDDEIKESFLFAEASEEFETEEETQVCPVCQADEAQVVVGEIAATEQTGEEVSEVETEEETADTEIEKTEDAVEDEEVEDTAEGEETQKEKENEPTETKTVEQEGETETEETEVEDELEIEEESIKTEEHKGCELAFNERAFNVLLNKFAKENYSNVRRIAIHSIAQEGQELRLEGKVLTTSNKQRQIAFITKGFKYNEGIMKLKLKEVGPFTESIEMNANRVPFVLECKVENRVINPVSFKCKYEVVSEGTHYECVGKYSLSE